MTADVGSEEFEQLLVFLRDSRGFDFTGYKRASLERRINKRMSGVGIDGVADYRAYLEAEPDEFALLFNTILINVTGFFRDGEAWEYLRDSILPSIADPDSADPVRVWSAGCASGEEAYTLAMLLAEALGEDAFKRRVKVYATDVDEDALSEARHGIYTEQAMEPVPPRLRERYFEMAGARYRFRSEFRRSVIFGRHDLVQDAPISRMNLIVCRNVLMYFNVATQARIVRNLHFALAPAGFLFLGHAELMLSHSDQFETVDLGHRVFKPKGARDRSGFTPHLRPPVPDLEPVEALGASIIEKAPHAQIVLDQTGYVVSINEAARTLFGLSMADRDKPFKDLEFSYRPFELRSHIDDAMGLKRSVTLKDLVWSRADGAVQHFQVRVVPLVHGDTLQGILIHLEDVSEFKKLQLEHLRANQDLETAYEELQSTNEELETTNEELQSTVEELETTNEELQSTNEELETMNEELQSTNVELHAVNDEFQRADAELRALNAFMGAVMTSIHVGLAVVDARMIVMSWNAQAEELWGVRSEEVRGRSLLELDIGLPVAELQEPIRSCLDGTQEEQFVLEAINRRGKPLECKITCTPLVTETEQPREVVILMEAVPKRGRKKQQSS